MGNCMACLAHGSKSAKSRIIVPIGSCANEADWRTRLPRATHDSKRFVQHEKNEDESSEEKEKEKNAVAPVRVKVVLSKKEAVKLLSRLAGKDRPPLESIVSEIATPVAGELKMIPGAFMHAPRQDRCWRPALQSIPEM